VKAEGIMEVFAAVTTAALKSMDPNARHIWNTFFIMTFL
jgi:hypothetical protein